MNNHIHLLCEATDRRALSRGLQGLFVRIAKALNNLGTMGTQQRAVLGKFELLFPLPCFFPRHTHADVVVPALTLTRDLSMCEL